MSIEGDSLEEEEEVEENVEKAAEGNAGGRFVSYTTTRERLQKAC